MKYKLVKETKPKLSSFGKYKAVCVHEHTAETRQILMEAAKRLGLTWGDVVPFAMALSTVIGDHLRQGHRVRLKDWGLMKLEIESDKVDKPGDFVAEKHIRGVRLHFLPESSGGSPDLYKNLDFERDKTSP